MSITIIQAQKMAEAARDKAYETGVAMNIAIVDEGANTKLFIRMDHALLGSGDIALKKARTSALLEMNSGDAGKLSQPGGPLYGIEETNGGLVTFPGGIVIKNRDGKLIGAIGVSGGTVEQDFAVALAGIAAFDGL